MATPQFKIQIQPDGDTYTLNVVDREFSDPVDLGEVAHLTHGGQSYVCCAYVAPGEVDADGEVEEVNEASSVLCVGTGEVIDLLEIEDLTEDDGSGEDEDDDDFEPPTVGNEVV